jgi:hypothetical protein
MGCLPSFGNTHQIHVPRVFANGRYPNLQPITVYKGDSFDDPPDLWLTYPSNKHILDCGFKEQKGDVAYAIDKTKKMWMFDLISNHGDFSPAQMWMGSK